jgi:hypothetical protein
MRSRAPLLLAIVTALLGAPSLASGASSEPAGTAADALLGIVLLIGLSGVAAVTVMGTALALAGRRRSDAQEPAAAAADDAATAAILARRTVRQGKVRLTDDPIVAAMGLDDKVGVRRRARGQSTRRTRSGRVR